MSRPDVQSLLEGRLGHFWVLPTAEVTLDDTLARPGWVQRVGPAINVKLLAEDYMTAVRHAIRRSDLPHAFVGRCEGTGVAVLDIWGPGGSMVTPGGSRASTQGYNAQTVLATDDVHQMEAALLNEATFRVVGADPFDWADHRAYDSNVEVDPETKRVRSASLHLLPTGEDAAPIPGLGEVALQADWTLGTHTDTGVSVDLALEFTVRSRRPLQSRDLLRHLGSVQLLLSSVFDGRVVGEGGWARFPGLDEDEKAGLWNSVLMHQSDGTTIKPYRGNVSPFVDLSDLGGVAGLSRWIRLLDQHPRAVAPIINRWRRGGGSPQLQLIECAIAIEYWVAFHRSTTKWANENKFWPLLASKKAAPEFGDLVGDRTVWADRFWSCYTALKHDPYATLDMDEVAVLSESAYYLVLGLMLDRVARSKAPTRRLMRHPSLRNIGSAVRETLGT